MRLTLVRLAQRWQNSVVFKLAVATGGIVALVALMQVLASVQVTSLTAAQRSIATRSVPLFKHTQEIARLTTEELNITSQLDQELPKNDLATLRTEFEHIVRKSDHVLLEIDGLIDDKAQVEKIKEVRSVFVAISSELFDNKFDQLEAVESALETNRNLRTKAMSFADLVDRSLVVLTTNVLTSQPEFLDPLRDRLASETFLQFANSIEVLNNLKSEILAIQNNLASDFAGTLSRDVNSQPEQMRLRINNISKLLTSLDSANVRLTLADIARDLNSGLFGPGQYVVQLAALAELQEKYRRLRALQSAETVTISEQVSMIVQRNSAFFNADIARADRLGRNVLLIGISLTLFILSAILLINDRVIQKQISSRLTTLFEDVTAIAEGDYQRTIRVSGRDELGDIAFALDVFKTQAAELVRSNSDLESFAQAAAHDLRSPLDAIQDLARWTLEDEREHLSKGCIDNLELIVKRSERLSRLQSDLLTYARVGKDRVKVETLDMQKEVSEIADLLDPSGLFNITWQGDTSELDHFGQPIRQILLNLVTNAIKHHDQPKGRVSVRLVTGPEGHVLTVQDDGPGIEPKFQSKIFELFKTLQRRDQVEGSGLGLAIVTKLADRIGGTIEVVSNAPTSRGAEFRVSFPIFGPKHIENTEREVVA